MVGGKRMQLASPQVTATPPAQEGPQGREAGEPEDDAAAVSARGRLDFVRGAAPATGGTKRAAAGSSAILKPAKRARAEDASGAAGSASSGLDDPGGTAPIERLQTRVRLIRSHHLQCCAVQAALRHFPEPTSAVPLSLTVPPSAACPEAWREPFREGVATASQL